VNRRDPKLTVLLFNDRINNRDVDGLAGLTAEGHVFIDSDDNFYKGKETMVEGWADFFRDYPDYVNHFARLESRGNLVLIIGHSTCSYEPLDGPALWTAKVEDDLVAEWRVYHDTIENRARLGLSAQ